MKTAYILLSGLLLTAGISNGQEMNKKNQSIMSTAQKNEAIVRRVYEECLNKRNMGILPDLISEDYPGFQGVKGPAGFGKPIAGLVLAFPDIKWDIQDLFGVEDRVAIRWKWQGTYTNPFNGFEPTGKAVTNEGMAIFVLKDGKIVSSQLQTDRLAFWQEIDVIPLDLTKIVIKP